MSVPKIVLVCIWLLCLFAFFLPADFAAASIGRSLFWLLLVVHAIECAVFRNTLRNAPGTFGHNLVQTMIFGVLHVRGLQEDADSSGSGA